MLTANEIRNATFNKSMGGYKTTEVEAFLDQCADTVAALTSQKAELEKKLEVLADKLVEYREEEDSIRTALLSAQRLGDTVVREANHKAGLILEDANIKAEKIVETAQKNIQDAEREFERIRHEITAFQGTYALNLPRASFSDRRTAGRTGRRAGRTGTDGGSRFGFGGAGNRPAGAGGGTGL